MNEQLELVLSTHSFQRLDALGLPVPTVRLSYECRVKEGCDDHTAFCFAVLAHYDYDGNIIALIDRTRPKPDGQVYPEWFNNSLGATLDLLDREDDDA